MADDIVICASGFTLQFHWIHRDTVALNKLADAIAGTCRKAVSGVDLSAPMQQLGADKLDQINP